MSTGTSPAEQRVVLNGVSWSTYLALLDETGNQHKRMAYDQGVLEIMSPSVLHERIKKLVGRMIEAFTEVVEIEVCSVSSTTFKRDDLKRGIESDECYYIQHASAVRAKEEIDLTIDPSPDLAVEVDITRSSLNKLSIYGALGIAEVWRYDGEAVHIFVLREGGQYIEQGHSSVLPKFPVDEMVRLLGMWRTLGETELIRSFRAWVRENTSR